MDGAGRLGWEDSLLPVEASDKEVQVAQDLGAVHKPINVAGVHSLVAASRACPLTCCQHKTVSAGFWLISERRLDIRLLTFWAQPSARLTYLESIFIYFHLVRRAGPDTRCLINHKII